jgi:predicted GIY-YIG superfamily endonuclease
VYHEEFGDKSSALIRERAIKKMTRSAKIKLIAGDAGPDHTVCNP